MLTGYQVRDSIEERLIQQRQKERMAEDRINDVIEKLQGVNNDLAREYRDLALFRLNSLEKGDYVAKVSIAETKATALMADRRQRFGLISKRIEKAEATLSDVRAKRTGLTNQHEQADNQLAKAAKNVNTELEKIDTYRTSLATLNNQQAIRQKAVEKLEQSRSNRKEKGKPYEGDVLFMYLWQQGYGTRAYHAGNLTRFFDQKLAKYIGFFDARPNYAMLLAIPERLEEHVARLEKEIETQGKALNDQFEQRLQLGNGDLIAKVKRLQDEIDKCTQTIERLEGGIERATEERQTYVRGEDSYSSKALDLLVMAIKDSDSQRLYVQAKATPSKKDDAIVERIQTYDGQSKQLDARMVGLRDVLIKTKETRKNLEQVHSDFMRRGYDRSRVGFVEGAVTGILLDSLMRGAIGRGEYWKQLQGNVRLKDNSSGFFGGHGFGGGGFSSGGGFGGGGFSSGGGFGGGGFSSGGDF